MLHSDPTSAITARLEELPFSDPRNNGLALRLRYARSVWRRVQWRWSNSRGSRFSALEGRLEYAALDLPGQRHAFCRRRRVLEVPDAAQVRQLVIQARQPTSTRPPPARQTGHGEQRQQHADGHDGRPHGGSGAAGGSARTERAQRPLAHLKGHCEQRTDQPTSTRPTSQTDRTRTATTATRRWARRAAPRRQRRCRRLGADGASSAASRAPEGALRAANRPTDLDTALTSQPDPDKDTKPFADPMWLTIGSFAESQWDLKKLCWSRTTLHAFLPRLNQLRRPGTEPPAQINFLPETELKPCPSLHAAPQQRERDAARNGRDFRDLREKLP